MILIRCEFCGRTHEHKAKLPKGWLAVRTELRVEHYHNTACRDAVLARRRGEGTGAWGDGV